MTSPTLLEQTIVAAKRDLGRERRRGEVLWVTIPFGVIAMLLIPMAVSTDAPRLRELGPGLYWVVVLLFGVLVTVRSTAADSQQQRDLNRLIGLDPAAGFAGRTLASFALLMAFELVVGAATVTLYDVALTGWVWLPVVGVLMSVVSAYYYLRVVVAMYMREPAGEDRWAAVAPGARVALVVSVALTLGFGLYPAPLLNLARAAAQALL